MSNKNDYVQKLEEKRKEALKSQDPAEYYDLSQQLGISPDNLEDRFLYEKGEAEIIDKNVKAKNLEKKVQKIDREIRIKEFLKRSKELNLKDYHAHADAKRQFLKDYFPGRFGDEGKQPIDRYDDGQVGFLYNKVYQSYLIKDKK